MSVAVGPNYATSATAGGDWSTITNAQGVEDGATADNFNEGPGGGGHSPSQLVTTGHGFALPATALIDGIKLEAKVYGDTGSNDQVIQVGKSGKLSTSTPNFGQVWPNPAAFLTWGGPTSLWGRTDWTYADINDTTFGASLSAMATHSTGTISIDAIRITVYYHIGALATNINMPKTHLYKVYNNGDFLGLLPNPSPLQFSQDINTAGTQITVACAVSADTAALNDVSTILDETGDPILDETGDPITTDGADEVVGIGSSNALIRNGNEVVVVEYSYYNPNGKVVFNGQIQKWEAGFGGQGSSDIINVYIYSDGQDMDNHLVRGSPFTYTGDQSQLTQNASDVIDTASKGAAYDMDGQTFTVGAGVTNLGAISLLLFGTANVTVALYTTSALTTLLAQTTQYVSVGGPTVIQFSFPAHVPVVAATQYFFAVSVDSGQSINVYFQNTNPYAGGQKYRDSFGGGGGGGFGAEAGNDLYFQTFSSSGDTIATFTSLDPTTGMLEQIINDYNAEGGLVTYDSSTIQATGLSLTYKFNTNTVLEGLQAVLSLSPDGFYYYVDLGTNTLYFKQANTVADIVLTKGRHLDNVNIVASIESIKNLVYFSGGVVSGSNLYKLYQDPTSIGLYGPRLDRKSDNRVTDSGTADAIGLSDIDENKDEQYQTVVTVLDKTMDITLLKVGMVVGFNGFGTFADNLLAQIVRIDYTPSEATLTLGILPKRHTPAFEKITRGLVALQTILNPSAPS